MATYVYETVPQAPGESAERFEFVQSMKDAPLIRHPTTGRPVRRVISGGFGLMGISSEKIPTSTSAPTAPCSPGCACHAGPRIPSTQ